jgi:hypothetical protein
MEHHHQSETDDIIGDKQNINICVQENSKKYSMNDAKLLSTTFHNKKHLCP